MNISLGKSIKFPVLSISVPSSSSSTVTTLFEGRGESRNFEKGRRFVDHHHWPMKKSLGFRWSKTTKITSETIGF